MPDPLAVTSAALAPTSAGLGRAELDAATSLVPAPHRADLAMYQAKASTNHQHAHR